MEIDFVELAFQLIGFVIFAIAVFSFTKWVFKKRDEEIEIEREKTRKYFEEQDKLIPELKRREAAGEFKKLIEEKQRRKAEARQEAERKV